MKTRIAFVNGIWQLCMVTAALWQEREQNSGVEYQDFLVVYTRQSGNFELAEFVLKLSQTFWNWKGTIAIEWTPSSWSDKLKKDKRAAIEPVLRSFGISHAFQVDEIWLCKLQFLDERLFADIFSTAQLVLYEDGLHTYAPTQYLFNLPELQLQHPKKSICTSLFWLQETISGESDWRNHGVKQSHLRRVKMFYSVLGKKIKISEPFQQVPTEYIQPALLQRFFSQIYSDLNCNFHEDIFGEKVALFLGSNLSHLHSFPKEVEANAFVEAIQQAKDQGFTIVWKEHPRSKNFLFELITQQVDLDNIICLTTEQKMPIELLIAQGKIGLCCSTLSSSLFYLKSIYGIKTVTCVAPLLNYLKGDFYALSKLTLATINATL